MAEEEEEVRQNLLWDVNFHFGRSSIGGWKDNGVCAQKEMESFLKYLPPTFSSKDNRRLRARIYNPGKDQQYTISKYSSSVHGNS